MSKPTNRFGRGFKRLGLVLSAPFALFGVLALLGWAFFSPPGRDESFSWGAVLLVTAGVIYLGAWSIGWVVAGFQRDDEPVP